MKKSKKEPLFEADGTFTPKGVYKLIDEMEAEDFTNERIIELIEKYNGVSEDPLHTPNIMKDDPDNVVSVLLIDYLKLSRAFEALQLKQELDELAAYKIPGKKN